MGQLAACFIDYRRDNSSPDRRFFFETFQLMTMVEIAHQGFIMVGKFVVLEGMDGSGTTTQVRMLTAHLRNLGFKVVMSAEPTDSAIGQEIRRRLAEPMDLDPNRLASLALCFAADRMQHVHETIMPALKSQDFIVLDRYVLSSLVYQGLHLPTSFIKEINRFAVEPDLTMVLDVDAKLAHDRLLRRNSTKDFYESPDILLKIRARYLHFAKDESTKAVLIDAHGAVDQVHSHVIHAFEDRIGR